MAVSTDPIATLAVDQHGVVTRSQALAAGVSASLLDRRVRSGHLVAAAPGLYRISGAPRTWLSEVSGACLLSDGVASHRTAAALLGVRGFRRGVPEVTTARPGQVRRSGMVVHRSRDLHLGEVRSIEGIPTTAPSRLAVDAGAVLREQDAEACIVDLVRRREVTWDEVAISVMRHSRRGRDGVGVARRIVDRRLAGLVGDSVLESVMLVAIADAGLPAPTLQVEIADRRGFIARVDAAWVDRGVLIEADGKAFHLNDEAFEADRAKRNRLRLAGWLVLEVTWEMLMDHRGRFIAQLADALDARPPGSFRLGCD